MMHKISKEIQRLYGCANTVCREYSDTETDGSNCSSNASPWFQQPECYQQPKSPQPATADTITPTSDVCITVKGVEITVKIKE